MPDVAEPGFFAGALAVALPGAFFATGLCGALASAFFGGGEAAGLAGRHVEVIHIVGGGSRNALLCQATADRSGLRVKAGPAEATAMGNMLVQMRALGRIDPEIEAIRAAVARSAAIVEYRPRGMFT